MLILLFTVQQPERDAEFQRQPPQVGSKSWTEAIGIEQAMGYLIPQIAAEALNEESFKVKDEVFPQQVSEFGLMFLEKLIQTVLVLDAPR